MKLSRSHQIPLLISCIPASESQAIAGTSAPEQLVHTADAQEIWSHQHQQENSAALSTALHKLTLKSI